MSNTNFDQTLPITPLVHSQFIVQDVHTKEMLSTLFYDTVSTITIIKYCSRQGTGPHRHNGTRRRN